MFAVSRYQSRRVDTASPVQLVVLLIEELLRRIELGAVAIESRKWRESTDHFHHARNIIAELLSALDPVPGVEKLVGDLDRLYVWSAGELTAASTQKDAARARGVGRALSPLLEAWRYVAARGAA